jgi:hypothetical protein
MIWQQVLAIRRNALELAVRRAIPSDLGTSTRFAGLCFIRSRA